MILSLDGNGRKYVKPVYSGVYVPSYTLGDFVGAISHINAIYHQVENTVTVFGMVTVTTVQAGIARFVISAPLLPASPLVVSGVCSMANISFRGGIVTANSTAIEAQFYGALALASKVLTYQLQYLRG